MIQARHKTLIFLFYDWSRFKIASYCQLHYLVALLPVTQFEYISMNSCYGTWSYLVLVFLASFLILFASGCDFKVVGPYEEELEGTTSAGVNGSLTFNAVPLAICEPGKCK